MGQWGCEVVEVGRPVHSYEVGYACRWIQRSSGGGRSEMNYTRKCANDIISDLQMVTVMFLGRHVPAVAAEVQ